MWRKNEATPGCLPKSYNEGNWMSQNATSKMQQAVRIVMDLQYDNTLTVKESVKFHDRFLIIDKTTLIHVGASLNHLGKKCFAFSSLDKSNIPDILAKI